MHGCAGFEGQWRRPSPRWGDALGTSAALGEPRAGLYKDGPGATCGNAIWSSAVPDSGMPPVAGSASVLLPGMWVEARANGPAEPEGPLATNLGEGTNLASLAPSAAGVVSGDGGRRRTPWSCRTVPGDGRRRPRAGAAVRLVAGLVDVGEEGERSTCCDRGRVA
jgi:hypothetical protein